MKRQLLLLVLATQALLASASAGEVEVVWERNVRAAATAEFRFQRVPAPSTTDAATNARFWIVAGREDGNSGDLDTLNDGRLPRGEDQPNANFFFDAGTNGGRIVVDLGGRTEIRRVSTYSWHRSTRGPQRYQLYAHEADGDTIPAAIGSAAELQSAGWRRLAAVDTRPAPGELGGQYGVHIADAAGGMLGPYRYLLFDISATAEADRFGNTFFSEIDVDDDREHVAQPREPRPAEIIFDATEVPELQTWIDTKLRPVCEKWYPIIERMLPSEGYAAPRRVSVVFRKDMRGVAATSGTRITCAGDWFRRNLEGEAAGAVVHELVHVVQQYGRARGGQPNPGWLVEGVADYIRWFHYEPEPLRPRPNPARAHYTDSYRITAAFLHYLVQTHAPDTVQRLNAAMRQGRYTAELWVEITGKTVDQLWDEYVQTLRARE